MSWLIVSVLWKFPSISQQSILLEQPQNKRNTISHNILNHRHIKVFCVLHQLQKTQLIMLSASLDLISINELIFIHTYLYNSCPTNVVSTNDKIWCIINQEEKICTEIKVIQGRNQKGSTEKSQQKIRKNRF